MATNLLLAVATAFLAAALGAIATGGQPGLLAAFLIIAALSAAGAVLWSSRAVRSRLPFGQPFEVKLHRLWLEGRVVRESLRNAGNDLLPSGEELARAVEWEGRVWTTLENENAERASVMEAAHGGRLTFQSGLNSREIGTRVAALRDRLGQMIRGTN